ncbi:MAG: heparinase II/III family protein, partial [Massilia sp.]
MSGAARLRWMFNRLCCMSPAEIGWRLRQSAIGQLEQRGVLDLRAPPPYAGARTWLSGAAPPLGPGERQALLADADHICAGHVTLFADRRFDVGPLPEWNRDPDTGVLGPAGFSGAIRVTDRSQVGDIKHLWELNRHLQLVRLAQAALVSGDPVYLRTLAAQLRGWLDQSPPQRGPNWTSGLELGIRLINWSLVWQLAGGEASALFGGEGGARLREDWLASIHAHCRWLARHLSRHSSANNHLIGELAGLYVAASTWPCWKEMAGWRTLAMHELEEQAQLQYSRDGVNREQAFAYHIFSAEFLFVAGMVGQVHARPFSRAYWEVLQRALRFLRSARDAGGHLPQVG